MWSAVEVGGNFWGEAGNFWGCEGFLPEFSQSCSKSFGRLCLQIFSLKDHEALFGMTSKKVDYGC